MSKLLAAAERVLALRSSAGHSLRDEFEAYEELQAGIDAAKKTRKPAKKPSAPTSSSEASSGSKKK